MNNHNDYFQEHEVDYQTNAGSYYDYLARKQKLFELLTEKITDLANQTELKINEFQNRLDGIKEEMKDFFREWLRDGIISDIIGEELDLLITQLNARMDDIQEQIDTITSNITTTNEQLSLLKTYVYDVLTTDLEAFKIEMAQHLTDIETVINKHTNKYIFIAKEYGVIPRTDITHSLQTLVNTLPTGAELLFEPNETYGVNSEILFNKDITLDFQNATVETNTPHGVQNIFKFIGEQVTQKQITARYSKGDLTVTLENTTDIKKGQTILISSTELYNTSRLNYRMGGYFIIENVTPTGIRLNQSMPFTFGLNSGTATIYNPIKPVIKNLNLVSAKSVVVDGTMGIRVEHSKGLVFENVYVDGFDHNTLLKNHIYSMIEHYSTGRSLYEGSGESYGFSSYTGTGMIIRQSHLRSGRHALTLSGNEPSYDTQIENCSFDNEKSDDAHAFDCHDSNHSMSMINSHCNGALFAGRCDVRNTTFTNAITKSVSLAKTNHFNYGHYTFDNCDFSGINIRNGTYKQQPDDTQAEFIGLIRFTGCNFNNSILRLSDTIRVNRVYVSHSENFKLLVDGAGCVVNDVTIEKTRTFDDTNIIASTQGKISNVSIRDSYLPSRYRAIYLPVNDNLFLDNVRFTTLTGQEPSNTAVESGSLFAYYSNVFMPLGGGSKITGKTLVIGDETGQISGGTLKRVSFT